MTERWRVVALIVVFAVLDVALWALTEVAAMVIAAAV